MKYMILLYDNADMREVFAARSDLMAEMDALLEEIRQLFPKLVELYDNTASLQDRTATTGVLRGELARQFGAPQTTVFLPYDPTSTSALTALEPAMGATDSTRATRA